MKLFAKTILSLSCLMPLIASAKVPCQETQGPVTFDEILKQPAPQWICPNGGKLTISLADKAHTTIYLGDGPNRAATVPITLATDYGTSSNDVALPSLELSIEKDESVKQVQLCTGDRVQPCRPGDYKNNNVTWNYRVDEGGGRAALFDYSHLIITGDTYQENSTISIINKSDAAICISGGTRCPGQPDWKHRY